MATCAPGPRSCTAALCALAPGPLNSYQGPALDRCGAPPARRLRWGAFPRVRAASGAALDRSVVVARASHSRWVSRRRGRSYERMRRSGGARIGLGCVAVEGHG